MTQQATELIASQAGSAINNQKTWGSIIYNVKDPQYGAKGDAVTDDTSRIASAITAASPLGGVIAFPPGTYVTGSLTVPPNITLWFMNGAKLSINNGATVTINGSIDAGLYQIFTGLGVVRGNAKVVYFFPQWWGAIGDGVANDTAAINASLQTAFYAVGGTVYAPEGIYNITSQIVIPKDVALLGCGIKAAPRWVSGSGWDLSQIGTVFAVKWGSGGSSITNAAFQMSTRTNIIGCCFWYPDQLGSTLTPVSYPPTISTVASDPAEAFSFVNSMTVRNCLFVNPWIAMDFSLPHQLLTVDDIQGTAWLLFLRDNQSYDVDRINAVQINPGFSYRGLFPVNSIMDYHLLNTPSCAAFEIGKADGMIMTNCFSYGFHKGLWVHDIGGFSPNGMLVDNCGFEGNNYSLYFQGTLRRIKVSNCTIGTNIGGNAGYSIYMVLTADVLTDEIILENVSSFQTSLNGMYVRNATHLFLDKVLLYACCQTNPGFGISVLDVANSRNITIRDCTFAIGGTNNLATNIIMDSVKAFHISNTTLYGQLKAASTEFFVSNSQSGRIEKTFIDTTSAGSHVVTLSTVTDVTAVDTIVY